MTIWDYDGIMDSTYLEAAIKMVKQHKYKIRQDKDGRWSTYVKKEGEERKLIRKKTKKELEGFLIKYYDEDHKSFLDAYNEWRSYHDKMVTNSSITKYDSDKKRYFEDRPFSGQHIDALTEDDIKVFIKEVIDDRSLCQAAIKRLFYYVKDTFDFGLRHGYLKTNPIGYLSAKDFYKYATKSIRSAKPNVVSDVNIGKLWEKYDEDLSKHPDYVPLYAVKLAALTGMRAGELAALKWEDVKSDHIVVCRSQKYDPLLKEYYISETKNGEERIFPITDQIRELLSHIKRYGGDLYLFGKGDEPITFRVICSCMKNKCRQVGIETHGIHAYRKTVNSKMALNGVPVSLRASLLGHSEEVNQKYYTYDVSSIDDKRKAVALMNTQMNTN